jgi:hypothetical protein
LNIGEVRAKDYAEGEVHSRGPYGQAIARFLNATGFAFLNKGVRWALRQWIDHLEEVDAWHESLDPNDRAHLNNPIDVWDRYGTDQREPRARSKAAPARRHAARRFAAPDICPAAAAGPGRAPRPAVSSRLMRPIAASEAQQEQVRKLRKAGRSLRWIAEETSLGLQTVVTIVGKAKGTDRTAIKYLKRIDPDRAAALRAKSQARAIRNLPRAINSTLKTGAELRKEAKGLK